MKNNDKRNTRSNLKKRQLGSTAAFGLTYDVGTSTFFAIAACFRTLVEYPDLPHMYAIERELHIPDSDNSQTSMMRRHKDGIIIPNSDSPWLVQ